MYIFDRNSFSYHGFLLNYKSYFMAEISQKTIYNRMMNFHKQCKKNRLS